MGIPSYPETRQARLERIKREIAAGTYDTPEKMEAALGAFLDRQATPASPGRWLPWNLAGRPQSGNSAGDLG